MKAAAALLPLVLAAAGARAEDVVPAKAWKDSAEASLVSANGNSKTQTESFKNGFEHKLDALTVLAVDLGALSSKSEGRLVAERFFAGEKVSRKVDDRDYVFEAWRWDRDQFAGIRHRQEFSLGAGRELWKAKNDLLLGEAGPTYVFEERIGEKRRDFGALRAFASYAHDFGPGAKFGQTAEWLQSLKFAADNRLKTETSLTTSLTRVFSFKASYTWSHVSQPPPNRVRDDTTTAMAIIASF